MAALFISAAHKSSGKTTLAIGINAALRERGLDVQPFKKGPDYIDPIWLGMAAGKPCYNLDFYVAGETETLGDYRRRSAGADIAVIEGNKGLHDGLDLDGSNSNAALAKALRCPVILAIDVRGTMRGIAPLLIGYQVFDREVDIAGVVASQCGGARHESKLRAAVAEYTDIPFLGALHRDPALELGERHLGLVPGYEDPEALARIERIAAAVREQVDLDALLEISRRAPQAERPGPSPARPAGEFSGLRIGIAQDRAFGFYYPGDLEVFSRAGAELVPIDTLRDSALPALDGLLLGGGFPERHAAALAANGSLRASIRDAIEAGLPAYAECGGLMYLAQCLEWKGVSHPMAGLLAAHARMHERPRGRGYVQLEPIADRHPWLAPGRKAPILKAHEFHYSALDGLPADARFAWRVRRGTGITGEYDGLVYRNLLATYSHQRHTADNPWVTDFLAFVAAQRQAAPLGAAGGAGS